MSEGAGEMFEGSFSRTQDRLHDAELLLVAAGAASDSDTQRLLAGCATVQLAVAVEEELALCMRPFFDGLGPEANRVPETDAFREFLKLPVRERLKQAVHLLSEGRLKLMEQADSSDAASLLALPGFRNALVHDGDPITLAAIVKDEGVFILSDDGQLEPFVIPNLRDPWRSISPAMGRRFQRVVSAFIDELQEIDLDDEMEFNGATLTTPSAR